MNLKAAIVTLALASIFTSALPVSADQGNSNAGQTAAPAGARTFKTLPADEFFSFRWLDKNTHFGATLFVASAIRFELGEDFSRKAYWNIDSYDSKICRLTLRHRPAGFLDWKGDRAEIELRALTPGSTDVVFSRDGKKITVHLTVQ